MKKFVKILSAVMALSATVTIVTAISAENTAPAEGALRFTPEIDGVIDDEYYQSYFVDHQWNNKWGLGCYAADNGAESYNNDATATSYFLWSYEEQYNLGTLYVAIDVTDNDIQCISDEKWQKVRDTVAAELAANVNVGWDPWYQDMVFPTFKVNLDTDYQFALHASADGRYATIFNESNFGQAPWIDWYSWSDEVEANKDEGLFAQSLKEDGSGYIIELCLPTISAVNNVLFKDGGVFSYNLQICDALEGSTYANDYAKELMGIIEESANFNDVIHLFEYTEDMSSLYFHDITLIDRAPDESETTSGGEDTSGGNGNETTGNGEPVPGPDIVAGDITGDGEVKASDLTRLMKYISGQNVEVHNPDLNDDGEVSSKDLTRLMKIIAGAEI